MFAMCEGIIPAPETNHAIKAAIDEAKKCKETGEEKTIVVNFSGHGLMDFKGYASYMDGSMENSKQISIPYFFLIYLDIKQKTDFIRTKTLVITYK